MHVYTFVYVLYGRVGQVSLFGEYLIQSPLRSHGNLLWREVCAVAIV